MKKNFKKLLMAFALTVTLTSVSFADCSTSVNGGNQYFVEGDLIPHATHYEKYFRCVNGSWLLQHCALELWFDWERQICNWPWDVNNPGEGPW